MENALASTLKLSVPIGPVLIALTHSRLYDTPSVIVDSRTFWKLVAGASPNEGHAQAIAKFLVPLGTESVTVFDATVAELNAPEPICVATATGVALGNVKVTVVGEPLPPPPEVELVEPPQPEMIRHTIAAREKRTR